MVIDNPQDLTYDMIVKDYLALHVMFRSKAKCVVTANLIDVLLDMRFEGRKILDTDARGELTILGCPIHVIDSDGKHILEFVPNSAETIVYGVWLGKDSGWLKLLRGEIFNNTSYCVAVAQCEDAKKTGWQNAVVKAFD